MPQFSPTEDKIAKVTFPVSPAGLDCTAELWLASDTAKVATSGGIPFVATGEAQTISLPITMPATEGTYPVRLDVFVAGELIAAYQAIEDVIIVAPPGLVLHFSNPKFGATFWDASIYDLSLGQWVKGTPTGIKQVSEDIPMTFELTDTTFLLRVNEWSIGWQAWLGPYQVTIPELGEYTWNSREGKLDGIPTIDLPKTINRSFVTGILERVIWGIGGWRISIRIEKAEDVPGYENVVQYFIGDLADYILAPIPLGPTGSPVIETGREITCYMNMRYREDFKDFEWNAWDFHYALEYPPEYYNFSGSLSIGQEVPTGYQIHWTISGVAPQCHIVAAEFGHYGIKRLKLDTIGPGSGTFVTSRSIVETGAGRSWILMYAHPDPNAKWGQYTWELNNWQLVAQLR